MLKKNVHVVPSGKDWAVKKEGNTKASAITDTKAVALQKAIPLAKNEKSSVIIHGKDGKIQDSDSYGNESKVKDKVH